MVDLSTAPVSPAAIRMFITNIYDIAVVDHYAGRKSKRTGQWLCAQFAVAWRHGHRGMASKLYNDVRWTLSLPEASK